MATLKSTLVLSLQDQVTGRMKAISAQMAMFQTRVRAMTSPFTGMTARLAAIGGGYIGVTAGMRGTVGAAIKFEEAFADVRKTLDASEEQFANVRRQILDMSKVLPNTAEGIASIYAAAAQSNIPMAELGKFTEMVAKVSVAWEVAEGETSEALAKIKNQLHMSVDEIGLYADAINHLGNNSAAAAPDLVDFSKRVAAQGELFGFTSEQTLAFGGAMIASGAQTNIAATSFRNMGMALADAAKAPKAAQAEFRKLGLNTKKLAKQFNTDAVGTMMDVFERIQALPEHERLSTAIGIFGREARALMPLINNSKELKRQLDLVGKQTDYAGSAFKEYIERANTVSNVLQIMRNRFRAVGIEIGDSWLPSIKEAALAVSDVFDTLGSRATPFDKLSTSLKAFMQGLGYDGSIKEMVNDLADLFLGPVDPGGAGEELGRLFMKMKGWGESVRAFSDAIRDNPIAQFIGDMAGHGFKLFVAAAGFTMLAGALRKLAKAAWLLSGAGVAVGIIKGLAGIGGALWKNPGLPGGGKPGAGGKPGSGGGKPGGAAGGGVFALLRQFIARLPPLLVAGGAAYGTGRIAGELSADNASEARRMATPRDAERDSMEAWRRYRDSGDFADDMEARRKTSSEPRSFWDAPAGQAIQSFFDGIKNWDERMAASTGLRVNTGQERDPIPALEAIRDAVGRPPAGTTDVRVTNPVRPNVAVNVTVNATSSDPAGVGREVGASVQRAIDANFGDSGGGW